MKPSRMILLTVIAVAGCLASVRAQDQADPPPPGRPPHPPRSPLLLALDANHDGVIDSNEIANASAALKALDKNGDGQLTRDELRPQFPGGQDGPPPPPPGGEDEMGGPPPPPPDPLFRALDTNHDGVIDSNEIANAATALKSLDKNGDGQLTADEFRPHFKDGPPPGPPPGM